MQFSVRIKYSVLGLCICLLKTKLVAVLELILAPAPAFFVVVVVQRFLAGNLEEQSLRCWEKKKILKNTTYFHSSKQISRSYFFIAFYFPSLFIV